MTPRSDAAMGDGAFAGQLREGPDGRLYEWNEGFDGAGERVGFWEAQKALKNIGRTRRRGRRRGRRRRLRRCIRRCRGLASPGLGAGSWVGELRQGPDGELYEWVEGVDGLGQPIGFWKVVKAVGRGVGKAAGRVVGAAGKAVGSQLREHLPTLAQMAIPGAGPAAAEGIRWARAAGLLGHEDE